MKVLIACEESQHVCIEFRKKGHEAYSCDIKECSGGHPEWHIKNDVLKIIKEEKWDMMIAHPPCTYICNAFQCNTKVTNRENLKKEAIKFFMELYNADIPKIAIENPVGIINKKLKPSQIIQPYEFGEAYKKTTCLWLKNLPILIGQCIGKTTDFKSWHEITNNITYKNRSTIRSKTFIGIAKAMAQQWG